jgi:carbamate kinase
MRPECAVPDRQVGCLICRTIVHAGDPALASPIKFVGPVYYETAVEQLAVDRGWVPP